MNLLSQNDHFAVRLYEFARQQFAEELQNGFPRLRSIKGTQAMFVIDMFQSLEKEGRALLMESCLRRAHGKASALLNEGLSEKHLESLRIFDGLALARGGQWKYIPLREKRGYREFFQSHGRPLPPEAADADFMDDLPAKIDRTIFFRELKARLAGDFCTKPMNCGAGEWELSASLPGYVATLNLDFGTRSAQLSYWHDIHRGSIRNLVRFVSIGGWLGVGALAWDLCTVNDSASVAGTVAGLANEFIGNVSQLLTP